jgi:hypothetical protein
MQIPNTLLNNTIADATEVMENFNALLSAINTGWVPADEAWAYASADAPSFVMTVPTGAASRYSLGMKIRLVQTTEKYFIITAITDTTLTLYGGTDYTLASAAITLPYSSPWKSPFGFPMDPTKWTVKVSDSSSRTGAASANTWTNIGSTNHQISIPIGVWDVDFDADVFMDRTTAGAGDSISVALSTANNTASDEELIALTNYYASGVANTSDLQGGHAHRRKTLVLASKTLYYLNGYMQNAGNILFNAGDAFMGSTVIRAVCAYL